MSMEENKNIAKRFIKSFNDGNLIADWDKFFHPDAVFYEKPNEMNNEESKDFMAQLHSAFPDQTIEIVQLIAEDDKVVVHMRESGTMTGPFLGMEPTGKQFALDSIEIYEIKEDKIITSWAARDKAIIMQQLDLTMPQA